MVKPCIICGDEKPLSEYYAHPQMADGHVNKCKPCYRESVRLNRLRRWKHYDDYERMRGGNRKRRKPARYGYRPNPQHEEARTMVSVAVRKGELTRPESCQKCGKIPGRDPGAGRHIEGHHRDYNKPLEVMWLCRSCHRREHAEGPPVIPLREES